MTVDWDALARELGSATRDQREEFGGRNYAQRALVCLLGEDEIRLAARYSVGLEPGHELARSVLVLLQAPAAVAELEEIYRSASSGPDIRALVLINASHIACLNSVRLLDLALGDQSEVVRAALANALRQLSYAGGLDSSEGDELLQKAAAHSDLRIRASAQEIRSDP